MTTSRQAKSFIDYSGWEVDDIPTPGFANHANFLKHVEDHVKEQAFHQRRRSRFEELYRQRQKLKQAHKELHETCQFPEIYVQNTQFLTVNTLDLNSTARRTKWLKDAKDNYRIHAVGARSMEVPQRREQLKYSRNLQAKQRINRVQKQQGKLCLEYRQGELIDDLASKHLSFYLQERRQQHLKAGKGIFQLPLSKP